MKNVTITGIAIIFCAGLVLGALRTAHGQDQPQNDQLDFKLTDLHGHPLRLSQWRGHPVVVDFWATWCPPCRKQIPELKKLYSRYHDSKGLVIVGVACDTIQGNGIGAVMPFVRDFAINYPVVLAEEHVVNQFGVEALPTTVFVGPDGSIVGRVLGARPGELSDAVTALVTQKMHPQKPGKPASPEQQKKENLYNISFHP